MGTASIFHWLVILIPVALIVWLIFALVARGGRRDEAPPPPPARIVSPTDRDQP